MSITENPAFRLLLGTLLMRFVNKVFQLVVKLLFFVCEILIHFFHSRLVSFAHIFGKFIRTDITTRMLISF